MSFLGYKRADGKVGIRNKILIIAVDECCLGIAKQISKNDDDCIILINHYTCMLGGNEESFNQLIYTANNPNVVGVVVIAMGCGSILPNSIIKHIKHKPCYELIVSNKKGTLNTINEGRKIINDLKNYIKTLKREKCELKDLIIGVKCGGSDTSSGIGSNVAVGKMVDKMIDLGATCIGGELFELIGCEEVLAKRAINDKVKDKIYKLIENEKNRWGVEGVELETMSVGNSIGGLSTIEEKSLGALHKMGSKPILDVLQINNEFIETPKENGFYLSEVSMLCGGAGVNFASLGAQMIVWTSASAGFNNPLLPTIRVSANALLINDDIDIDVTGLLDGRLKLSDARDMLVNKIISIANGKKTNIEDYAESAMSLVQKDLRVEKLLKQSCFR